MVVKEVLVVVGVVIEIGFSKEDPVSPKLVRIWGLSLMFSSRSQPR